ncbi:MAG: RNA polymerase sigma factor [Pirellulales bacterium]|nr:RNA polymerase sigma factor [Pirellulales bacterium]
MTQPRPRDKPETDEDGTPKVGGRRIDWQQVLAEHERWLRTVIYTRVGEPQAVEEVLQEVSLAAVRQKAPISDPTKVSAWLYRLAVMQTLLYRRKQGRRRKLIDRYAERNRPRESDNRRQNPLDWLLSEERREKVRTALKQLSRRDAEILLLKYTEDWSYRELADHLGVSESAVEARLHRARGRLRAELAAHDVVAADA